MNEQTEYFLGSLLIAGIYFLFSVLFNRKPEKTKQQKEYEDIKSSTKKITIGDELINVYANELIKNNLGEYLLTDFVDIKWLDPTKDNSIKSVCIEILKYLRLSTNVSVYVDRTHYFYEEEGKNIAGSYQRTSYFNRQITIKLKGNYNRKNVLAILCHECTHFFMEKNNLNIAETKQNEVKTDIMSCLIGFAYIMKDGYKGIETYNFKNNTSHITILGYITYKDCENIYNKVNSFRLEYRKRRDLKEQYDSVKNNTYQLIDTINEVLLRIFEEIDYLYSNNCKLSKDKLNTIQQIMSDISKNDIESKIKFYKSELNRINNYEELIIFKDRIEKDSIKYSNYFKNIKMN